MREFENKLAQDEHAALGAFAPVLDFSPLQSSHTIPSPTVHQQDDLHTSSVLKQQEKAQAAAKARLVAAITSAKVGKAVELVPAPHL
jgi:hypothetical protein